MRNQFSAAALLALVLTAPAFAEDCKLKRYTVMPFELNEAGLITVPVTLGSLKSRMMVDTGAYWSFVNEGVVANLNLNVRTPDLIIVDAAGEEIRRSAIVPAVKIGELNYGPAEFFVSKSLSNEPIDKDAGIIGINLLTRVDMEIDNAAKTISFFSAEHCRGDGVHWADEAVTLEYSKQKAKRPTGSRIRQTNSKDYKNQIDPPIVTAELEGEAISVLFDTGASYSAMDLELARRRFGVDLNTPGVVPAGKVRVGGGGTVDTYSYTFKTLTIAGIKFENVPILLGKFDEDSKLILGMHQMRHLHIYFSFAEGLIHVTAADAGKQKK